MAFEYRKALSHAAALCISSVLAGTPIPAIGQTYVWKDPETGQTNMSSTPPPWYSDRSKRGPRTQLIINGQVVDDTGQAAAPETASRVKRALDEAATKRADTEREQRARMEQAEQVRRQNAIAQLRRQRVELMVKIAGGPIVAGSGPFDVASVSEAAKQLAEVNRQLNALDPAGVEARAAEQRRGLGAAARARQEDVQRQRDRTAVRDAVRDGVREGIRDCARLNNC